MPARLRLAVALLFLCVPLAALEVVLVTRAPWWRLPVRSIEVWSVAVFFLLLPLAVWIMRGRVWAARALEVFFAVWVALNTWVAIRTRHPELGFMTLGLASGFGAISVWLRHELSRSFFDPQMRWYHGLPKALPGVRCLVAWGDHRVECDVSRLDREGTFVFRASRSAESEERSLERLRTESRSELTFSFRGRSISCIGVPIRALEGNQGAGFQFGQQPGDHRKQLGDFIEILRGEGYVL